MRPSTAGLNVRLVEFITGGVLGAFALMIVAMVALNGVGMMGPAGRSPSISLGDALLCLTPTAMASAAVLAYALRAGRMAAHRLDQATTLVQWGE